MFFKNSGGRKGPPRIPSGLGTLADEYERRYPAHQNAIDLIPGWSTEFPHELQLKAGTSALLADARIEWVKSQYGDLTGKRVLELGPLEGGHTAMLEAAGTLVDAVEGNSLAYLKCLITKEIVGLKNAKFYLGDFNRWLEENDSRYDLIVASGVLYHMIDPLRLLELIGKRTDCIYIWSMIVVADDLVPSKVVEFNGATVRLYRVPYGERSPGFCGGPNDHAYWLHRDDLVKAFGALGFGDVRVAHESKSDFGTSASFFVRRTSSSGR